MVEPLPTAEKKSVKFSALGILWSVVKNVPAEYLGNSLFFVRFLCICAFKICVFFLK